MVLIIWPSFSNTASLPVNSNPSIDEILERVQHRYGFSDFEADFVQESHLEAMGIVDTAKGHVYFKPPFMMRWHYKEPEEYLIITDGQAVWIYRPMEKQVMIGRAADYFGDTNFAEFFSEPSKLRERFKLEMALPGIDNKDHHVLRLVPHRGAVNVEEVFLTISRKTYDIIQSDTLNAFGDKTRLGFSAFQVNQGLDMSLFRFEIPENVDVMQLDRPY
jgi:outer membrane lipoprotein carrier protein